MHNDLLQRLLFLLFTGSVALSAQVDLKTKSPFLPPNYGVVVAKTPAPAPAGIIARQLEFRGVIQIGEQVIEVAIDIQQTTRAVMKL